MSLFTGPQPVDDRVRVWIVTKPWMRGWWFVLAHDYDPSMFGFTRIGFRRSRLAAIHLAQKWVTIIIRRNNNRR